MSRRLHDARRYWGSSIPQTSKSTLTRHTLTTTVDYLVIGAGPTGLGAAQRLAEAGADFRLLERQPVPGGLAASFGHDGFTWDVGGHVIFSHYPAYDAMLAAVIDADDWVHHPRRAYVHCAGAWVPYPFQNHLDALPAAAARRCRDGLAALVAAGIAPDRSSFDAYIRTTFGDGIAELFMQPYNRKVWSHPLERMSTQWLGERVAPPSSDESRPARSPKTWGPNSEFRFPCRGGTGAIWRSLASRLPPSRLEFGAAVVRVRAAERVAETADGRRFRYRHLLSTMPLTHLVRQCGFAGLSDLAGKLAHAAVDVIGIGFEGAPPAPIGEHSWMYFPDHDCPFYRATVFSNYSDHNAPPGCWSLLLEVSHSAHRPRDTHRLAADCLDACRRLGLAGDAVRSSWHYRAEHGYPVPTLDRDHILDAARGELEPLGIFSRGRFGAWKYEVGNMDHSYMQGREVVERWLLGSAETTIDHPALVNGR